MDFWTKEELSPNPQPIQPKKEENQAINFDDFQNFDPEEKERSEDLLQSQDLENSKNRLEDNLFSQNDFSYHFQQQQNQILPTSVQEIKSKIELMKKASLKEINEEKRNISNNDEEINKIMESPIQKTYCQIHEEEGGFLYCKSCKTFNICVQCIVKGCHKNHDVMNLKANQINLKHKYEENILKLKEKNEVFRHKGNNINDRKENAKIMVTHNNQMITAYFKEIYIKLSKKEKEFIERLEDISNKNLKNLEHFGELINKNTMFIQENLKKYGNLSSSDNFLLYKLVLEDTLDSLLKDLNSSDFNLMNDFNKSQSLDEEIFNQTLMKINNFLGKINESLEISDQKFDLIFENQKNNDNKNFIDIEKPQLYEKTLKNFEERTILVSLQKPHDLLNINTNDLKNKKQGTPIKKSQNITNFNNSNNFESIPKNLSQDLFKEQQYEQYPKNQNFFKEKSESLNKVENSLQRLRNEIKSLSPSKQIYKEYQNPFNSSSNKEIYNQVNLNRNAGKLSSFSINQKNITIKKSYIEPDISLKNSFLSKRNLFKSNYFKDSRFFGVDDMKITFFESERPQRLKHFGKINQSNLDKLTFKKEKKFIL